MPDLVELARRVGLQRTWSKYPAEVEKAIADADRFRSLYRRPDDPAIEQVITHPFHAKKRGVSR